MNLKLLIQLYIDERERIVKLKSHFLSLPIKRTLQIMNYFLKMINNIRERKRERERNRVYV